MDRRDVLRGLAYGAASIPLLNACGGTSSTPAVDAAPDPIDAPPDNAWATGGTRAMTGKAGYPDPFTVPPSACLLVGTTTLGPCTTAAPPMREDISEGWTGIPVRLALKVVDTACNPLVGATVTIWHTNIVGSYSGQTPNNAFCVLDPGFAAMDFFRGVRTTASDGTVFFDTCYPGWYRGRAIHLHFQIKQNNVSTRVSQLFFPEDLTQQIFATHPEYKPHGQPDTRNSTDGIFNAIPASERARLILETARMTDGAMLASKVIAVQ